MAARDFEQLTSNDWDNPSYQAFQILRASFTIAPIVAGIDKFFHFLVNWDMYLAPIIPQVLSINGHTFMLGVGLIEIIAGILVALSPRIGGYLVTVWLWGIIANLLLIPGYFDIALRDFGLSLGSFALARIATVFEEAKSFRPNRSFAVTHRISPIRKKDK
jgi:hypothetical protein